MFITSPIEWPLNPSTRIPFLNLSPAGLKRESFVDPPDIDVAAASFSSIDNAV